MLVSARIVLRELPLLAAVAMAGGLLHVSCSDESTTQVGPDDAAIVAALPDVEHVAALFTDWAATGNLTDEASRAQSVLVIRVDGELPSEVLSSQERLSGTHQRGDRFFRATILQGIKAGEPSEKLTVVQDAAWFNGTFVPESANPPLEVGKSYLVFLKPRENETELRVVLPSVHLVVDGHLYWAGARDELAPDGEFRDHVRYQKGDARFGLWGVKVEDAAAEIFGRN